ncbi:hypothetical protein L345_04568, partial [Ophiophagus hannah]
MRWDVTCPYVKRSTGSMGCGNEPTSRSYTPSKQILLCTAKSLENSLSGKPAAPGKATKRVTNEKMKNSKVDEKPVNNEVCTEPQKDSVDKKNDDEKPPDSSDDENKTGQKGNETQKRIAPLQLMGEFLKAIMERKYNLAKKLCQMKSQCADKEDEEADEESSDEAEEESNSSEGSETE